MRKAILFDIDGTLVVGGNPTHRSAFEEACKTIFGIHASPTDTKASGKTDKRIYVEVLQVHGIPRPDIYAQWEHVARFMETYFVRHSREDEVILQRGVTELLTELKTRNHILGVLTGNLEIIGWLKLHYAGIKHFFDVGSFGGISEERADLVEDSIRKLTRHNPRLQRQEIFVVGDTPHDIACGTVSGVKTIAVATGRFSIEELHVHRPSDLVENLGDTPHILHAIDG